MQLRTDGIPVITTPEDQQKANRLVDRIVEKLYDRLPRIARAFLSREQLAAYLRETIVGLAQGL